MQNRAFHNRGYIVAAALGALGGMLLATIATRAIPRIMSGMMSGMMQNMMAQMGAGDCDPGEM